MTVTWVFKGWSCWQHSRQQLQPLPLIKLNACHSECSEESPCFNRVAGKENGSNHYKKTSKLLIK